MDSPQKRPSQYHQTPKASEAKSKAAHLQGTPSQSMTVQRGQMRSALDAPAIIDSHVNVPLTYTKSQKTFEPASGRAVGEGIYTAKMEPAIMNSARRPPTLPNGRKEPVRASVLETRSSKSFLSFLVLSLLFHSC